MRFNHPLKMFINLRNRSMLNGKEGNLLYGRSVMNKYLDISFEPLSHRIPSLLIPVTFPVGTFVVATSKPTRKGST